MSQRFVPKRGTRGTAEYLYFELSMAQGPRAIGDTRDNLLLDFIGTAWLLLLAEDMTLHLFRQDGTVGEWTEIVADLPPVFDAPLPATARRVTFAFDQSARIIVIYEDDGLIYVTRWDTATNAYVQNVTFAGHDPVVVFDATWAYDVPVSDVLLFYLSSDRDRLLCRVQRQLYAVENELHDYAQPVVFDRVIRTPYRYQALASDAVGDPLVAVGERVALLSDLYPLLADETFGVTSSLNDGQYIPVVIPYATDESLSYTASLADGAYESIVLRQGAEEPPVSLTASLLDGAYEVVVIRQNASEPAVGVAAVLGDGTYDLVVIRYAEDGDAIGVSASLTEGSYEAI